MPRSAPLDVCLSLCPSCRPGYVDDYYGYDFAGACLNNVKNPAGFCVQCVGQPNPTPFTDGRDSAPHGTHVAGLIAAVQNNAIGVSGIAPRVLIMTLKVRAAGRETAIQQTLILACRVHHVCLWTWAQALG